MRPKTIFIVDDDGEFRRFEKAFLAAKPALKIVGEADSGPEASKRIPVIKPDLVLMDIHLSGMDSLSLSRRLKRIMPNLRIILMTIFDDRKYRESALRNGVSGCVVKSNSVRDLMPAIRAALRETMELPGGEKNLKNGLGPGLAHSRRRSIHGKTI